MSIVKMSSLVGQMKPRELLEVIVAEPGPKSDVLTMVPGCDLVGMDMENGSCRLLLEKRENHAGNPAPGSRMG